MYDPSVRFSIFADLSRPLTADEQGEIFAALDALVPNSGCVGPNRSGVYEVFFVVDADTSEAAQQEAARYMDAIVKCSGVAVGYEITLQPLTSRAGS